MSNLYEKNKYLFVKPNSGFSKREEKMFKRFLKVKPINTSYIKKYHSLQVQANPFKFLYKRLLNMKQYMVNVSRLNGSSFIISFIHNVYFYNCGFIKVDVLNYMNETYLELSPKYNRERLLYFIREFIQQDEIETLKDFSIDYSNLSDFFNIRDTELDYIKTLCICDDLRYDEKKYLPIFSSSVNISTLYKLFCDCDEKTLTNIIFIFSIVSNENKDFFSICDFEKVDANVLQRLHPEIRNHFSHLKNARMSV
jgi:hypothetical protein